MHAIQEWINNHLIEWGIISSSANELDNTVWFRNNEKNYLPISLAIHYNPVLQKYIISVISNIIF